MPYSLSIRQFAALLDQGHHLESGGATRSRNGDAALRSRSARLRSARLPTFWLDRLVVVLSAQSGRCRRVRRLFGISRILKAAEQLVHASAPPLCALAPQGSAPRGSRPSGLDRAMVVRFAQAARHAPAPRPLNAPPLPAPPQASPTMPRQPSHPKQRRCSSPGDRSHDPSHSPPVKASGSHKSPHPSSPGHRSQHRRTIPPGPSSEPTARTAHLPLPYFDL